MKKAIIILTALAVVLGIFTSCAKKKTQYSEYVTNENGEYVTDSEGNKQTTIIDAENVSVEYVTDKDGKKTIDENGEYVTVLHVMRDETVTDSNGKVVTQEDGKAATSKQSAVNTTLGIGDEEGQTSVAPETTIPEGKTTKTSERLFDTKVLPVLKSGVFTMKMTFTGNLDGSGSVAMPAVLACDTPNNRLYMETSMGAMKLKCIVKDNKMYIVMPSLRAYSVSDYSDEDGDMGEAMKEITDSLASSSASYVKTTETTYNKVKCICEEYKEGSITYRYFFQKSDQKFVRMEAIDGESGQSTIMNIQAFSAGVQNSYFQVPAGYKQMDLEAIANAIGS